jgi:L-malate glycosyltransferase
MRVLFLTPTFSPRLTGNAVTVSRIVRLLSEAGTDCRVVDLSAAAAGEPLAAARSLRPDVVHAFHAFKAGRQGLDLHRELDVPLVVSITGTDLYVDMADGEKRRQIMAVLAGAARVTVFNREARAALRRTGVPGEKIAVVHQSALLPEDGGPDYRTLLDIDRAAPVVLMLGGVRRVKNIPAALSALERVRKRFPAVRLLLAGPVLEAEEFARISAWCAGRTWVSLLGAVPRERVPALLDSADVLLNTSLSESESNAVLEALSRGKIVVARNIPGNASLLGGGAGCLFRSDAELPEAIAAVLADRAAWEAAARTAQARTAARFGPARECGGYLAVYRECVAGRAGAAGQERHGEGGSGARGDAQDGNAKRGDARKGAGG